MICWESGGRATAWHGIACLALVNVRDTLIHHGESRNEWCSESGLMSCHCISSD